MASRWPPALSSQSTTRSTLSLDLSSTRRSNLAIPDRFYADNYADWTRIQQFDPSIAQQLLKSSEDPTIWVAVYRNPEFKNDDETGKDTKPSVFVREDFLQAMKTATEEKVESTISPSLTASTLTWADQLQVPLSADDESSLTVNDTPMAIARLCPSKDENGDSHSATWILDSLRCSLPKENTNPDCDGGSEYLEALGVAVDAVLIRIFEQSEGYQKTNDEKDDAPGVFLGSIRVKSTLFSRTVLEGRGFVPVDSLSKDMATHFFSREACLDMYTIRSLLDEDSLTSQARSRTQSIISSLRNQLDYLQTNPPDAATKPATNDDVDNDRDDNVEIDPWAGFYKMQL